MALLELQDVHKSFRDARALDGVTLEVAADALTVVCGPPQSGKSVLMRMLVGLETPDSGRLLLNGKDLAGIPPGSRRIGYVPQSFALYPHMSVFQNIAYPLYLHKAPAARIRQRVDQVTRLLGIPPRLLDRRPDQLSGGEKQRTAVARGLLNEAEVFVLDDPLVGLDFKLRERLMEDLRDMRRELGVTFLYATSDSLEALTMADRLVVLDAGRVVEQNTVGELYEEPMRLRSAELIGFPRCNVFDGHWDTGTCRTPLFDCPATTCDAPPNGGVAAAVRPEDIAIGDAGAPAGAVRGSARVRLMEDLGSELIVHLASGHNAMTAVLPAANAELPPEDADVAFSIDPARIMLFDAGTGRRIGRGRRAADA